MKKLKNINFFMFDLDGTIYLGDSLIKGAKEIITYLNEEKIDYVFLTNNSSKNVDDYYDKLLDFGINTTREQIITSGIATANYIINLNPEAVLYVVGTNSFKKELVRYGFTISKDINERIDYLVVGYDTELNYKKLTDAVHLLNKDVPFIATNPDLLCPMENDTYLPDCGLICNMLEVATNKKPTYIGKPRKEMIETILKLRNKNNNESLIIGDRIYTDIQNAINANTSGALVLSGETTMDKVLESDIKPDFIFNDVSELLKEYIKEKNNND